MTGTFWMNNLLAYAAQVCALAVAAAILSWAFRLKEPRLAIVFWRGVLAACLILPAAQPWAHDVLASPPRARAAGPVVTVAGRASQPAPPPVTTSDVVLAVLAAGCVIRFAWTALGLARLRQYRRRARAWTHLPVFARELKCALASEASVAISDDVRGPVTFGLVKPVILLPDSFLLQPEPVQRAVLCHELLHVARRDAAYTLAEEAVASLLWFHPAVWWLVAKIRLSCEQAVDRLAIGFLADRKQYLNAVLETAGIQVPAPGTGFATPLLGRSQLVERVALIAQEIRMSKMRLFASTASTAVLLIAAATLAVRAFPLRGEPQDAGPQPPESNRVRIGQNAAAKMLLASSPCVSPENAGANINLEIRIGTDGSVVDASVGKNVPNLVQAAVDCVKTWRYQPLILGGKAMEVITTAMVPLVGADGKAPETTVDVAMAPTREPRRIVSGKASEVPSVLGGIVGGVPGGTGPGVVGGVPGGVQSGAPSADSFPPPEPGVMRVRVGENVAKAKLQYGPEPVYPPLARQARIQGTVRFLVLLAPNGEVKQHILVSGHPLLVPAAQEVLSRYQYQTTLLNGNPVEVVTQVSVPFVLP